MNRALLYAALFALCVLLPLCGCVTSLPVAPMVNFGGSITIVYILRPVNGSSNEVTTTTDAAQWNAFTNSATIPLPMMGAIQ